MEKKNHREPLFHIIKKDEATIPVKILTVLLSVLAALLYRLYSSTS